ncbi:fascin domain-containing protein [Ktedonobacter robiniae]|nr:hypothetical protein [Ktedonobacter robiniae]
MLSIKKKTMLSVVRLLAGILFCAGLLLSTLLWVANAHADTDSYYLPGNGDQVQLQLNGGDFGFEQLNDGKLVLTSGAASPVKFTVEVLAGGKLAFRTPDGKHLCHDTTDSPIIMESDLPNTDPTCQVTAEETNDGFGLKADNDAYWQLTSYADRNVIEPIGEDLSTPDSTSFIFTKVS